MKPQFNLFKRKRPGHRDAEACDIAAHCVAAVVRQLYSNTAEMGVSELRGYVRARGLAAVQDCVSQAVADGRVPPADEADLIRVVLESTVHLVVRELQSPPIVAIPSPHVRVRTAA